MKMSEFFLSKWLYYVTILVVLLALFFFYLPSARQGDDMAANVVSEIWGLIFTLVIFIVILDFRKTLEWKRVESRVKRRLGRQIHVIFIELSNLCELDRVLRGDDLYDDGAWAELKKKQLKSLISEQIKLNDVAKELWEKRDLAVNLASFFDSRRAYLSEMEGKYLRFLDSELQASLMDIQDYLEGLRLELRVMHARKEDFYKSISDLIGEIMKEIAKIRERKINIGF